MDWTRAIDLNRDALRRIVAALFSVVGLIPGPSSLSRDVLCKVLQVLLPAESATRRLVFIAARDLCLTIRDSVPAPCGPIPQGGQSGRAPAFRLYDVLKRFPLDPPRRYAVAPRITFIGYAEPDPIEEQPSPRTEPVDAARLLLRMQALKQALDDLPKQARRLASIRMRREATGIRRFFGVMRPGRPPGFRARTRHDVDDVLKECHLLAMRVLHAPDTS